MMTLGYQIGLRTSNVKETRVKPISEWLHVSATGLSRHQIGPLAFCVYDLLPVGECWCFTEISLVVSIPDR